MVTSHLEVDVMTFVEEEIALELVIPQPLRKSPKEKRKKKKKSATRESEGQFVIRLKTPRSRTTSGSRGRGRKAGKYGRSFDGTNYT
jgi:hypothetical protein